MGFMDAVRSVLRENYATFSGRAPRSELWWFALFSLIVSSVLSLLDSALFGDMAGGQPVRILAAIWALAVFVPSLAVGVRRLHDIGRSGWWYLIVFVPLIGALILIYWFIQRGTDGPNPYGADPLR